MMRKCHLNTCPMGVATQSEELRRKFVGRYEYLVNFFNFLAEDVREHLAGMGFRKLDDIVGRTDLLEQVRPARDPQTDTCRKMEKVDLSRVLFSPAEGRALRHSGQPNHTIERVLDEEIITRLGTVIESPQPIRLAFPIRNTDRAVGAMLAGKVTLRHGAQGLPDDTVRITFNGSAGQSFGAFLVPGVTFILKGDANDYLGKGLSGGRIIVVPPEESIFSPEENIIAGNTLLYGATSGEVFINGRVGERFCIRNSGATAVVEGAGDHCCEYMTGGCTVVLGPVGRNFGAGMSGGVAYVWDPEHNFDYFCNMDMVELSMVEDRPDYHELYGMIQRQHHYMGSPLARRMLADWETYVTQFVKVTPIEYKKVLHARRMAELEAKIAVIERDY